MDNYKLKNCILIVLVLVNFFLLFIVVSDEIETKQLSRRQEDTLRQVLLDNEIELDKGVDLSISPLPEINMLRSLSDEKSAVSYLIGRSDTKDLGGSIIYYDGSRGAARFRGTADFELVLDPDVVYEGSNPVSAASAAVKKLGFKPIQDSAQVTDDSSGHTVVLGLAYKGTPVFNSRITCYFVNGSLNIVEGRAFFSQIKSRGGTEDLPDACTILMRFLEYISSGYQICTKITDVEAGYISESTVVGECVMRPVWRIATDTGTFFFDGVTGSYLQLNALE